MRRTAMLFAATAMALLLASAGIALAATIVCDGGVCRGTGAADTLRGSVREDTMYGYGGHDRMTGNLRADIMYGGTGVDTINGGYGRDRIFGQSGNDVIRGGPAIDTIEGGPGRDTIDAENGNDVVRAVDGDLDSISCGLGKDTAIVDSVDLSRQSFEDFVRLTSCENVTVR